MTFPQTVLDQGIEIYVNGAWLDISTDIYSRNEINISRGKPNEGAKNAEPSLLEFTLDNNTFDYSPRNPTGTYYGQIGRNTRVRHWVKNGQARLRLENQDFRTPDSAGVSVTGDIDLRVDCAPITWRPENAAYIAGPLKLDSYGIYLDTNGTLVLFWYDSTAFTSATSTEPIPGPTTGRKAVRATLDVDNGGGGHSVTFYYSDDDTMDGTWVQFGDVVTGGGTTSIDDTSNPLVSYMSIETSPGEVYEMRVYDGIAGTKRASPKFIAQASGTTSFDDAEGNTWSDSLGGGAALDNKNYRMWGEISHWPPQSDRSGNDVYLKIEAQGLTRRIGQGSTPLKSALRRGIPAIGSALVGYWPLEDGKSASTLTPGISTASQGRVIGKPSLANYSAFVASDAVPTLGTGKLYFRVPFYTNTDEFQVRFLTHVPASTIPNNTVLMRIRTNSSLGWIDFIYQTGDVFLFKTYTNLGVLSHTTSGFDLTDQVNNQDTKFSLEFAKNGTGVDLKIVALPVGENVGVQQTETNSGITLGSCTSIYVNPDGIDIGETAIGHLTVENTITSVFDSAHALERAYQGEQAHNRIDRLCDENGIVVSILGLGEGAEFMGYQEQKNLLSLLREAEQVDGGFLTEQRNRYGLLYRTRESLYNQPARVTLNYSDGNLTNFNPTEDDQRTENKVSVARSSGQGATVEDTDSALSTSDPPNGAGLYESSDTVSLYSDDQAFHQAGWKVRLGTVDEARLPQITINLAHPDFSGNQALVRQILALDCGDKLDLTNPPSWLPPETMGQIIQGISETLSQYKHEITFNCAPSSPYRAAMYEGHPDTVTRFSNENTTTNEALDTTETGIDIIYSSGPDWTHSDGDYDIMIGGERMTLTGVSGSGGSQTLTVTRSVNGVVKSHSTGADVKLFDPAYYSLGVSPGSGDNTDIDEGRLLRAMDHSLPDVVTEYGNGVNAITSTSFATLPTYPVNAYISNPHPTATMLCIVGFGAWGSSDTGDVRLALRVKRSEQEFIAAGVGAGASIGYGEIPATALSTLTHIFATCTVELDPSPIPYVFQIYAMRSTGSGNQDIRYATVRIVPLRYIGI